MKLAVKAVDWDDIPDWINTEIHAGPIQQTTYGHRKVYLYHCGCIGRWGRVLMCQRHADFMEAM